MINGGDIDLCEAVSRMSDEELHDSGNCGGERSCWFCREEADEHASREPIDGNSEKGYSGPPKS